MGQALTHGAMEAILIQTSTERNLSFYSLCAIHLSFSFFLSSPPPFFLETASLNGLELIGLSEQAVH